MPATLPAEPLEDRWLDQPRVLSSNVCYCSAARWYARPAWAVRSVVWPIFCHGYKKAELKNERVTFWFFFSLPNPRRFFSGKKQLWAGNMKRIHQPTGGEHCRPSTSAGAAGISGHSYKSHLSLTKAEACQKQWHGQRLRFLMQL